MIDLISVFSLLKLYLKYINVERTLNMARLYKFIDIGANLTDAMYCGIYNGSKKHERDLEQVLNRSWDAGLSKIIITAGNYAESEKALELAKDHDRLYSTVGCHPTRCKEFEESGKDPKDYLASLKSVIEKGNAKIVAIGECGLDYDRLQFCPKDIQKKYFELQLNLCDASNLPLFLHCRNAAEDFYEIIKKYNVKGVVHSFDGTLEEAQRFINLGFYIGLNGCSLKTKENLDTVSKLPQDRIMIETDSPWCEVRPTHAGYQHIHKDNLTTASVKKEKWKPDHMVKSRNEPCNIRHVLDILAHIRKEDPEQLSKAIYENTTRLFWPSE